MMSLAKRLVLTSVLVLLGIPGNSPRPTRADTELEPHAPLLLQAEATEPIDLGTWDDACVIDGQDFVLLRRGAELFSLSRTSDEAPKLLRAEPALEHTTILAAQPFAERLWLMLQSRAGLPFAFDVKSSERSTFAIPGLALPGDQIPVIQTLIPVAHAGAALAMVSGGDGATWPRPENRPLYFWLDLQSGRVVSLPIGWDLSYFSADQTVAVFSKPSEKPFERPSLQGLQLRGGEWLRDVPNRRQELCIPFDWQDDQSVKGLYGRRAPTGDADFFAGLSLAGSVLPLAMDLEGRQYLAQAKAHGDFLGFRLRKEGSVSGEPSPYWIVRDAEPRQPMRVANDVTDFALLTEGQGVFVTYAGNGMQSQGQERAASEAWFHDAQGSAWNVLQGVDRMPPLDERFATARFVLDKLSARLVESTGSVPKQKFVLCLFTHHRADMRANVFTDQRETFRAATWHRAIALTAARERYLVPFPKEQPEPELIWLHHSGRCLSGDYVWHEVSDKRDRQVQLKATRLSFAIP